MVREAAGEQLTNDVRLPGAMALFARNRTLILGTAALLFALVVSFEWISELEFSLGIFYVFPIIVAATVLNRRWVVLLALVSAFVRGQFIDGLATHEFWLRFAMATLAYAGVGLFVVEMTRNRRALLAAYARLKLEKQMRQRAENQLQILVESSPAAILTLNGSGEVLAANQAAHEMLGFTHPDRLVGKEIEPYIPLFSGALRVSSPKPMRTSASSWAKRVNGATFPVTAWFSTYENGAHRYLAGILVDNSEEIRERERENFRHMLNYNRLLAGAVSHEIRNMCSAIRVVTSNLGKKPEMARDRDFGALVILVNSLATVASFDLDGEKAKDAAWISLNDVFEQLRVVIEPDWSEIGGTIDWKVQVPSPRVYANTHGLLQVFLNLSQNSLRAVQGQPEPRLEMLSRTSGKEVIVSAIDNGPGVQDPSRLFQPFREDANGSGLGLYVSRTLAKSFGGQLHHVPTIAGCRFDVTLVAEGPHA